MTGMLDMKGVEVLGPISTGFAEILDPGALEFVAELERRFGARRRDLLQERVRRQAAFDAGERPRFFSETAGVRSGDWKIAPPPADLQKRTVEITGPVSRKMVINALNSDADVFMADFEDSSSPTWENMVEGQINLRDAVRGSIDFTAPNGKHYELADRTATLLVRPRGWHLEEKHVLLDGAPVSASLFDFGLFFFHNAQTAVARGTGPYFYLPKLESHLEARLWNDVFIFAQEHRGLPRGTVKATVLIETITAAFEMDEILFELKDHSAGLNCGRWDYIFSVIKKFRNDPSFVLPDRAEVTMGSHFLRTYSQLLIQTCHRRGAHAMGGMAAQIPIKSDPDANQAALDKVELDKLREVTDGHDGTWVAHPGLVGVARTAFESHMQGDHQLDVFPEDLNLHALLLMPKGKITEAGLRTNLRVGVQYLAFWLAGTGCVPIRHLMEDAATAEISRAQVWQWIRHGAELEDGRTIDRELVRTLLEEEIADLRTTGEAAAAENQIGAAMRIFDELVTSNDFAEFLTLPAYKRL